MSTSTLTSKGQTTIPIEVRKQLNLHPGDRLEFVIDEDGRVLILPASIDVLELAGMLKRPSESIPMSSSDIWCRTIPDSRALQPTSLRSNAHVTIRGSSIASCCVKWSGCWKARMGIQRRPL